MVVPLETVCQLTFSAFRVEFELNVPQVFTVRQRPLDLHQDAAQA